MVLFTNDVSVEDVFWHSQDLFVRHLPSSYLGIRYQDFDVDGVVGLSYGPGEDGTN